MIEADPLLPRSGPHKNCEMDREHRKLGTRFWAAVAVLTILISYPLSFGPACWIAARFDGGESVWNLAYHPLIVILLNSPCEISDVGERYLQFGTPEGTHFWRDVDALRWQPFEFDLDVISFDSDYSDWCCESTGSPSQQ